MKCFSALVEWAFLRPLQRLDGSQQTHAQFPIVSRGGVGPERLDGGGVFLRVQDIAVGTELPVLDFPCKQLPLGLQVSFLRLLPGGHTAITGDSQVFPGYFISPINGLAALATEMVAVSVLVPEVFPASTGWTGQDAAVPIGIRASRDSTHFSSSFRRSGNLQI